jgi:hypothetical protein
MATTKDRLNEFIRSGPDPDAWVAAPEAPAPPAPATEPPVTPGCPHAARDAPSRAHQRAAGADGDGRLGPGPGHRDRCRATGDQPQRGRPVVRQRPRYHPAGLAVHHLGRLVTAATLEPGGVPGGGRAAGVLRRDVPAIRPSRHRRLVGAPAGTVASGVHSNRRPPLESLNAIGDARIDCFEHFWQPSGREAAIRQWHLRARCNSALGGVTAGQQHEQLDAAAQSQVGEVRQHTTDLQGGGQRRRHTTAPHTARTASSQALTEFPDSTRPRPPAYCRRPGCRAWPGRGTDRRSGSGPDVTLVTRRRVGEAAVVQPVATVRVSRS